MPYRIHMFFNYFIIKLYLYAVSFLPKVNIITEIGIVKIINIHSEQKMPD